MSEKLTVVATMKAKEDKIEELRQELVKLLEPTRKEEGCINYDMHESQEHAGEFLFYENWTSREVLERHLKTPHLSAFFAKEAELLEGSVGIKFYRMSEVSQTS